MPRKKSTLDNLNQAHGKLENRKITLDQVWGDDGKRKYGTLDPIEYEKYLKSLSKTDLQAHATKIGLVPPDSDWRATGRTNASLERSKPTISSSEEAVNVPADNIIDKTIDKINN